MSSVFIGIGSNVGDRLLHIQNALALLITKSGIEQVVQTAFLYQSSPMYHTDQDVFLNTCAELIVSVTPNELLLILKCVEAEIGRIKSSVRNGPRSIDMDILFFANNHIQETSDLIIPHPRLQERSFVLAPLMDLCPNLIHPVLKKSISQLHAECGNESSCMQIIPGRVIWPMNKAHVMGILNCTPDSFSDCQADEESALERARVLVREGSDILDIGGESTNPKAKPVSEIEEQRRVVNVIKRIRKEFPHIVISIDTYKASTAEKAILAGADIVNDVSGGLMDPFMIPLVASLKVPYVCMHGYKVGSVIINEEGVFENVTTEEAIHSVDTITRQLHARVAACIQSGIYRWNIWVDPGLGFGKNANVSYAIIYNWERMFAHFPKYPILFGASRKRFVRDMQEGKTGTLEEAILGTVVVTVGVGLKQRYPNFHRVHDVESVKRSLHIVSRMNGI